MNNLSFLIARTLRREAPLAALSLPMDQVLTQLEGSIVLISTQN